MISENRDQANVDSTVKYKVVFLINDNINLNRQRSGVGSPKPQMVWVSV